MVSSKNILDYLTDFLWLRKQHAFIHSLPAAVQLPQQNPGLSLCWGNAEQGAQRRKGDGEIKISATREFNNPDLNGRGGDSECTELLGKLHCGIHGLGRAVCQLVGEARGW